MNSLNVGKLRFIIASLKGLSTHELGAELDRLCADQDPISFYSCFFQALNVRKKNILFMGPPGVGVGTCMRIVAPVLLIPSFRSKYIIQKEMQQGTDFGLIAEKYVLRGELIPDDVMIPKIIEVLKQPQYRSGLIMDGFPRTIKQAEALEEFSPVDLAMVFTLPKHLVVKKLMNRRVCPKCNRSYILSEISEGSVHLPAILPQNENLCDDCNVPLVVRSDDNPKIIEARYDIFEERTKPVLEFYREKKILCEFGIKQGVQDLPAILRNILIHFLSKYN
ncbi:uncharacterized protein [Blastocystis hominis]|uniref:Uncharacterized protein n=1 Tax=Blastocystis hominis TaxID=12968 RepID=D8LYW4_BLAHO|nr:uncharacterized protein [Blastocystis hominis]CBK21003.2 unnamed protein product [Blastocystis hominis]|eukprot:XP_012895051.1 uncharacterized protein [Blastocystis hominis]